MAKTIEPAFVNTIRPDIKKCMLDYFCKGKLICFGSSLLPHIKGGNQ